MRRLATIAFLFLPLFSVAQTTEETKSPNPQSIKDALSESTLPDRETYAEEVKRNLNKKGEVKGIKELPIKKLFYVEAEAGTYVVSADGRFVFDGKLVDVWHRKTIRDLNDVEKIQRTPVSNIGFKPESQLATFQFGDASLPRSGVVFVDPTSEYTSRFLKHIQENESKYNWSVVLMPLVGGPAAFDRARRIWCAKDRNLAKLDLVYGTTDSFGEIRKPCSEEPLQISQVISEVLSIESLPHIIREDGLVSRGLPIEFDEWFDKP